MSEVSDAAHIVEVSFSVFNQSVMLLFKTTEFGMMIFKAITKHVKNSAKSNLKGEVTMDKLLRFEDWNLSVARFEEVPLDELKELLKKYGVTYAVMPESEVNGIKYTNITFPNEYKDMVNSIIQHYGGNGEIISDKTIPKYIESGEVSLPLLMTQNGSNLMAYQFPESVREDVISMLNAAGIKYAVLPDLNLGDGLCEIAYSPQQNNLIKTIMERYQNSCIKSMSEYAKGADPKDVESQIEKLEASSDWVVNATRKAVMRLEELGADLSKPIENRRVTDMETGLEKEIDIVDEAIDDVLAEQANNGDLNFRKLLEARKKIKEQIILQNKSMMQKAGNGMAIGNKPMSDMVI